MELFTATNLAALREAAPDEAARALAIPGGRIRVLDGDGNDVSAT